MARIYLASDDEITSIIEKLKSAEDGHVILVVPKNTTLLQSVINVRLLKKKADELKKTLGIVTTDQTSKHLAMQVGLSVYARVEDVPKTDRIPAHKPTQRRDEEETVITKALAHTEGGSHDAVNVKQYERHAAKEDIGQRRDAENASDARDVDATHEATNDGKDDTPDSYASSPSPAETLHEEDVVVGKEVVYSEEQAHRHRPSLRPARRPITIPAWVTKITIVIVILALVGVATAAVYVPKAEVTLHVPTESSKKTVTLLVNAEATSSQPTTLVGIKHQAEADGSGESKATGKKSVGDKAKGAVTISNSWSTDPQSLAKNTALVSSDKSLTFRTVSDATIAGATVTLVNGVPTVVPGKTDVAVVADQPGDQYNIGPSKVTIQGLSADKTAKITGANSGAMTGGTTRDLTVVASSDIDQAKKDASDKATSAAAAAIEANGLGEELFLPKTVTFSVQANDPSHAANDEADKVTVQAHATAVGLAVRTADLESTLKSLFQDGLGPAKQAILPDLRSIDWAVTPKSTTTFELSKEIEVPIGAVIDASAVQKLAAHKMKTAIGADIKDAYIAEQVDVAVTPSWWPLMPFLSSRISIHIVQ